MELSALLSPLPAGGICGRDLSFSPDFDEIAEARRADDPTLEQGEWRSALKEADWALVARRCEALLAQRSKDLRIAGWLAEAWTHSHGIAGLGRGLSLLEALCARFWDGLHPLPDDDDFELRSGALAWVAGRASGWLRRCPLTDSVHGRFSLADLEAMRARTRQAERSALQGDALPGADAGIERFDAARAATPRGSFEAGASAVSDCLATLDALEALLEARLGAEAPGWSATRDTLQTLAQTFDAFAGRQAQPPTPCSGEARGEGPGSAAERTANTATAGAMTRDEAIRQLREVARFFRATEPHSPVAYLAEKAARWGEMPLHEWLRSVVRDGGELAHIEQLLGLEAAAPTSD